MTDTARVVVGLVCCGVLQVFLALVWAVLVTAGRVDWDQDEMDMIEHERERS